VYHAVFLIYFISAIVILLASLALMVQFSLLYNRAGKSSVFFSFIPVVYKRLCCLNMFLLMSVFFQKVIQFLINFHFFFTRCQISWQVKSILLFTSNWILSFKCNLFLFCAV